MTAVAKRRRIGIEVTLVLALTLGRSGVYSVLSLLDKLTQPTPLGQQTTSMNTCSVPDRLWLSLAYDVADYILPAAWVGLALYLLYLAHGRAFRLIGLDRTRPARDLAYGVGVCAAVGSAGLAFYLATRALGINTAVAAGQICTWWSVVFLVLSAVAAGLSEEVIMLGYLITRLKDAGWRPWSAIALSAAVRGSYHLYQGFGGFAGNVVMGVVFAWCYRRWGRVLPLVIAHTLMDIVAFVGYPLLKPYLGWL
ncbi:MAG: CPBP family intramembrane metalloprotease [Propionibacteriaceae bacterium]|nr:CPBP family intramembrane metalloprotease [Propionibacteriaceae bacterium]